MSHAKPGKLRGAQRRGSTAASRIVFEPMLLWLNVCCLGIHVQLHHDMPLDDAADLSNAASVPRS